MGSPHGEVALILALAPPAPGSLQDQDPNWNQRLNLGHVAIRLILCFLSFF